MSSAGPNGKRPLEPEPAPDVPMTPALAPCELVETSRIKIAGINAHSGLTNRLDLLRSFVESHRPDVLIISETGLRKNQAERFGNVDHYTAYHAVPTADMGRSRGTSVLIADKWLPFVIHSIDPTRPNPHIHNELSLIKVTLRLQKWNLHIVGMYGKSETCATHLNKVNEWLKAHTNPDERIILAGDMNVAPDPILDRNPSHDAHETQQLQAFQRLLSDHHLVDTWRELHGDKVEFSFHRKQTNPNPKDSGPNASRIDLVLISSSMRELVQHCEYADEFGLLTPDHRPILYSQLLPDPIPNLKPTFTDPPPYEVQEIDIRSLSDPQRKEAYEIETAALTEADQYDDPITSYETFVSKLITAAERTLGKRTRTLNKKRKSRPPSKLELTRGRCASVLCSEKYILRAVKNGQTMQVTETMQKLVDHAPEDLEIPQPPSTSDPSVAAKWFITINHVMNKITEKLAHSEKTDRAVRILDAIERRHTDEQERPRRWYDAVRALKASTRARKQQLACQNEVNPTQNTRPEFERTDPEGLKEAIKKYYEYMGQERTPVGPPNTQPWFSPAFRAHRSKVAAEYQGELMAEIGFDELNATIRSLPNGKASGPDGIAGELLKALPQAAVEHLARIFSALLRHHRTPDAWRHARIFTIHKSGDVTKCSNYRPISLQSTLYKTFMTVLTKRLSRYAEKTHLISNAQGGFRKDRTCLEKVELLNQLRKLAKRKKLPIHIVFADIKKAYDCVPIDRLLETLREHRLDAHFVELIQNIYSDNIADVITAYGNTPTFKVRRGVKQGCPMSPILFNLFIEPLLDWMTRTCPSEAMTLAYADDMCLFSTSLERLQQLTTQLQTFLHSNCLELGISVDKSKTVYMTTDKRAEAQVFVQKVTTEKDAEGKLTLKIHDTRVPLPKLTGKESYKYLGIWWNVEGDKDAHLARAKAKLHYMCMNLQRAKFTTLQTVKIFNQVIVPIVTFGFEVIRPTAADIESWNWIVRKLINRKVGIHWNSTMELHHLPTERLGLGLIDLKEHLATARVNGLLKRGLNSADGDTALAVELSLSCRNTTEILKEPISLTVKRNPSHTLPSNSLLNVFYPNDNAINTLHACGINNTDDLIDTNGEVHTHLRDIPQLRPILDRIRVNYYEEKVDPRILHRIQHQSLTQVNPTNTQHTQRIYTDGSIQRTAPGITVGGFGVHTQDTPAADRSVRTPDCFTIFDNELHGLAAGLANHTAAPLEAYLDNESVRTHINKILKEGHIPRNTPVLALEPTRMIINALALRRAMHLSTSINTILSHTDDGTLPKEEVKRRNAITKQKYGPLTETIVSGNKRADQLAKESTKKDQQNLVLENRDMPRFLLYDKHGNIIQTPTKCIREAYNAQLLATLRNERRPPVAPGLSERKMYLWLDQSDADWKRSRYLSTNKDPLLDKLQNFAIRARRGLFADKQTRLARQSLPHWNKRYGNIMVKDDRCDRCGQTETRFHFCECPAAEPLRRTATHKIVALINSHLEKRISDIPIFWAREGRHGPSVPELWKNIENRDVAQAAMGIIPAPFITWLRSLKWKDNTNTEEIVARIQIIIVQAHHNAWNERCKTFNAKHLTPIMVKKRLAKIEEQDKIRHIRAERKRERTRLHQERKHAQTTPISKKPRHHRQRRPPPDPPPT